MTNPVRRGRCPQRPGDNGCTPVVPLIRHGFAMPPSPLRGEGYTCSDGSHLNVDTLPLIRHGCAVPPSPRGRHCAGEFSLPPPRGKVAPKGRMRVGIVGCGGHRTGGWGHPPLRRVTIDFVGAAVPSGPESPRRFAALPPFTRGAAVTHHQAPLSKADSPYQGEMSRRDKRDRASWHGRSTRKGYAASVRQQSCQRLRSDVGIRNPRPLAPL